MNSGSSDRPLNLPPQKAHIFHSVIKFLFIVAFMLHTLKLGSHFSHAYSNHSNEYPSGHAIHFVNPNLRMQLHSLHSCLPTRTINYVVRRNSISLAVTVGK